jgi:hypothetical protein
MRNPTIEGTVGRASASVKQSSNVPAGLLTYGSMPVRRLPSLHYYEVGQWRFAASSPLTVARP